MSKKIVVTTATVDLPAHLKKHRTEGGAECKGDWEKVYSAGGDHIGWHCRCGKTEGLAPSPRRARCPRCSFFRHAAGCTWVRERAADNRSNAKEAAARATKLQAIAKKHAERALRLDAQAVKAEATGKPEVAAKKRLAAQKARDASKKSLAAAEKSTARAVRFEGLAHALMQNTAEARGAA